VDTSELRTFVLVANVGSFTRASAQSGIPQPTLSRQIGRLEEELGSPLFYRHGRGVTLTNIGQRLKTRILPLLVDLDILRDEIAAQSHLPTGVVHLGIPPSISRSMAASIVATFRDQCPSAQLHITEGSSSALAQWLESGVVDVAMLYSEQRSPNMLVQPLLQEDLFVVGRPRDLPEHADISLREIDTSRLILPGKGEALRRTIARGFASVGIPLNCTLEIDSVSTMKILADQNGLFCILPYGAALREVTDGRLLTCRIIDPPNLVCLLAIGTALSRPISQATKVLIEIIKQNVRTSLKTGSLRSKCENL